MDVLAFSDLISIEDFVLDFIRHKPFVLTLKGFFLFDVTVAHIFHHHIRIDNRVNAPNGVDVVTGDFYHIALPVFFGLCRQIRGATHFGKVFKTVTFGKCMYNIDNRALGIAIQQNISAAIHQNATAHFI